MSTGVCRICGVPVAGRRMYCPACKRAKKREWDRKYRTRNSKGRIYEWRYGEPNPEMFPTNLDWLKPIAAVNAAAREAGMSYGKYVASGGVT